MRNNGLIMTKLDVRLKQVGKDKMHDLLENRNMGIICNERKLKKKHKEKMVSQYSQNLDKLTRRFSP